MSAEWRSVKGYDGLYEVSNLGEVRKIRNGEIIKRVIPVKGSGMLRVILHKGDNYCLAQIASIMLEAFTGAKPEGCKAFCIDGNYSNLNLNNIKWVKRSKGVFQNE